MAGGALRAVAAVAALPDDEVRLWRRRLSEARQAPPEPPPRTSPVAAQHLETVRCVLDLSSRGHSLPVMPVSLELYAEGTRFRWLAKTASGRAGEFAPPRFSLVDDVGTTYEAQAGAAGRPGGGRAVTGETEFVPGVPATARRLTLATGPDRRLRIEVTPRTT